MKKIKKLALGGVLLLLAAKASALSNTHYLCVFDPVGRSGDIFTTAKDIVTDYLRYDINFQLYPYSTETAAKADFRSGLCDAIVLTGFAAREYNSFTTTIEALGAIRSYETLWDVLSVLAQPKAAPLFLQDQYEIVGIYPAGGLYIYLKDRSLRRVEDAKGKRFFVLHGDRVSEASVEKLGAIPVLGDTTNFASKFKRGRVDAIFAPAAITEALELDVAMGDKGGVIDYPLLFLTLQIVIKKDSFPEDFGQKSRELSLEYFERATEIAQTAEAKLEPYWVHVEDDIVADWIDLGINLRSSLEAEGVYDARMLKLIMAVRCKRDPGYIECQQ